MSSATSGFYNNPVNLTIPQKIDHWIHTHPKKTKVLLVTRVIFTTAFTAVITPILGASLGVTIALTGSVLILASTVALFARHLFVPHGRLLFLNGEKGTVACRVSAPVSRTLPRISKDKTLEFATRSFLRLSNLRAVRGAPGASMVGPCDYLGNLGQLDKHLYSFDTTSFPPNIQRTPISENTPTNFLTKFDDIVVTTVRANWICGKETTAIQQKRAEYQFQPQHLRQSLFLHPGLLEIDRGQINLNAFDPRGVDLSSFKARLVDNSVPFQISQKPLPSKDDYRVVTYRYEEGYADWQVQQGSGLFLEKHRFSQTITPITPDSKGFVVLARLNENDNELELIGIRIPYEHTLIIEEECIHGDTTLNGFFMMGMTSDHTTMRTADTVFLKDPATKKNVNISLPGSNEEAINHLIPLLNLPEPYVLYTGANSSEKKHFKRLIANKSIIFNPFNALAMRSLIGL
jgi:hypothetical protein